MPRNKDLKRLVRRRMNKTGEAYTTARAQIIKDPRATKNPAAQPGAIAAIVRTIDYAGLAGMSDAKIEEKTGRSWQQWTELLDGAGAVQLPHRDIAALVNEQYQVDGWWSQTVTVGYERIKGLRERGQRRDGTYEASRSRTFNVPVSTLFRAWARPKTRQRWLPEPGLEVRTATEPKSIRLGWSDGTIVAVGFEARDKSKSTVSLTHSKLRDREKAEQLKQYWSERLELLGQLLAQK